MRRWRRKFVAVPSRLRGNRTRPLFSRQSGTRNNALGISDSNVLVGCRHAHSVARETSRRVHLAGTAADKSARAAGELICGLVSYLFVYWWVR